MLIKYKAIKKLLEEFNTQKNSHLESFNWLEMIDKIRTECRDELLEMKDAMKAFIEKI